VWVEDKVRLARPLARHPSLSVSTALAAVLPVALVWVYIAGQPAPWTGRLGPKYPGAAVLAGKVTSVPAEPVLPPLNALSKPSYWKEGCLVGQGAQPRECVFGDTEHPVLTVALVGDSTAGNWWAALQPIAVERHWKLVTDLRAACAWGAAPVTHLGKPFPECSSWGATVLHDLLTTVRPDVVITSDYPNVTTVAHPKGGPAAEAEVGAGMARYWTQLSRAGISVVAIRETPDVRLNEPECVVKNPSSLSKCDVPTSKAITRHPPTEYAARLTGVPVVDMNTLICGPRECSPIVGNVLVFFDSHHMTASYSLTTAPFLEQALLSADKSLAPTPA